MRVLKADGEVSEPLAPYLAVDRSESRHECWVAAHMVAGLDGAARVNGRVGALSTPADQILFRRMRQIADVVLVGAETVRREGYGPIRLSETDQELRRSRGQSAVPRLAIVTRSMTLNWSAPLFAEEPRPYVLTGSEVNAEDVRKAIGFAEVIAAGSDRVEPSDALRALADRGHRVVLCEGGPHLLGQFVAADRVDELFLTLSPKMGGDNLPVAVSSPGAELRDFTFAGAMVEDDSVFLRYRRVAR